jgi:hypothetical protein
MLRLLAPVLPTDPAQLDATRLVGRLPRIVRLVTHVRRRILEAGLTSEPALDALAKARGANAVLFPLLRVAAADRDKAFWGLHVNFESAPPFLALSPSEERLRKAAAQGERESESLSEETARVLPPLFAPVPPWKNLAPEAIAEKDEFFA